MAKNKKRGRPKALEKPGVRARLLKLISRSRSLKSACAAAGVSYVTMRNECERDPEFAEQIERAQQEKIGKLEDAAHALAPSDGPTLRWLLACLAPDRYSIKPEASTQINIQSNVINGDPIFLPPDQRAALLVSLMGQPASPPVSEAANGLDQSASGETIDGTVIGTLSEQPGEVLPAPTVAKANGHSGNGRH